MATFLKFLWFHFLRTFVAFIEHSFILIVLALLSETF